MILAGLYQGTCNSFYEFKKTETDLAPRKKYLIEVCMKYYAKFA